MAEPRDFIDESLLKTLLKQREKKHGSFNTLLIWLPMQMGGRRPSCHLYYYPNFPLHCQCFAQHCHGLPFARCLPTNRIDPHSIVIRLLTLNGPPCNFWSLSTPHAVSHMQKPDEKTGADGTPAPAVFHERRNSPRQALNPPRVAVLRIVDGEGACPPPWGPRERPFYIDVYDGSPCGLLLWTTGKISKGDHFQLFVHGFSGKGWRCFEGQVRWAQPDLKKAEYHFIGCTAAARIALPCSSNSGDKPGPFPSDYEFFRLIPFLKAIHRDAVCPLLNSIRYRSVKAGERFICQGEDGDVCYIVQSGTCRVVLEKHAQRHQVGVIKEREFVGEMALLTG
jgi:hypothetical protein